MGLFGYTPKPAPLERPRPGMIVLPDPKLLQSKQHMEKVKINVREIAGTVAASREQYTIGSLKVIGTVAPQLLDDDQIPASFDSMDDYRGMCGDRFEPWVNGVAFGFAAGQMEAAFANSRPTQVHPYTHAAMALTSMQGSDDADVPYLMFAAHWLVRTGRQPDALL